ncbi:hypothetical protein RO3G_14721 [Rhizopus delemar RA 99-880]|uniref:Uncharacterized protein n=1 Tax=Rhizopus delemar (strain RA 99-880 / ATCC MYA-4621 / FGSC 9543 / NRRL 43880) TaxID=246409 RepID=I1CNI0_RHIO9|nr:hypothetical protein RO3G_14721 [Rhizopus delemar RA 99-880]|eukprot:EIE90010.1 hypothetical protein RO3G_14721 [Rhizopus delemar RA 99-880]
MAFSLVDLRVRRTNVLRVCFQENRSDSKYLKDSVESSTVDGLPDAGCIEVSIAERGYVASSMLIRKVAVRTTSYQKLGFRRLRSLS